MGVVGGSRHYVGGGLGDERGWSCPNCGAENTGVIAQGCNNCGAGKPGRHVGDAPPPPRVSERAPDDPTYRQPSPSEPAAGRQGDIATRWVEQNPYATPIEAYRAGYLDGVRAARQADQQGRREDAAALPAEGKVARTIVAALDYFADQVLRHAPEEVQSGEWCSVDEVRALIHQLTTTGAVHG